MLKYYLNHFHQFLLNVPILCLHQYQKVLLKCFFVFEKVANLLLYHNMIQKVQEVELILQFRIYLQIFLKLPHLYW